MEHIDHHNMHHLGAIIHPESAGFGTGEVPATGQYTANTQDRVNGHQNMDARIEDVGQFWLWDTNI